MSRLLSWLYILRLKKQVLSVRKALALANQYGFGFTLITKSDRVLRDLDLLKAINDKTKCVVQMTLTTHDENLCKKIEPNVSTTKYRKPCGGFDNQSRRFFEKIEIQRV